MVSDIETVFKLQRLKTPSSEIVVHREIPDIFQILFIFLPNKNYSNVTYEFDPSDIVDHLLS